MNNVYSWAVRLQDLMSGPLGKLASTYERVFGRMGQQNTGLQKGLKKTTETVEELRQRLSSLTAYRDGLDLKVDFHDFVLANHEIDRLEKKIAAMNRPGSAGRRGGGLLGGLLGAAGLGGPFAVVAAVTAALAGGAKVAGMGMDAELTKMQYEQFAGSKAASEYLTSGLNKFADDTFFDNEQILKAGSRLLMLGESIDKVIPKVKRFADISAGSGAPIERLMTVFGQVKQQGYLQGDELEQFAENLVPIVPYLAKVMKVQESEVRKLVEARKVSFDMVDLALQQMTEKGGIFAGFTEKRGETASGQLDVLIGTFNAKLRSLGKAQTGTLKDLFEFGTKFIRSLGPVEAALGRLFEKLRPLGDALHRLFVALGLINQEGANLDAVMKIVAGIIDLLAKGLSVVVWLATKLIDLLSNTPEVAIFRYLFENFDRLIIMMDLVWGGLKNMFRELAQAAALVFVNPVEAIRKLSNLKGLFESGMMEAANKRMGDALKKLFQARLDYLRSSTPSSFGGAGGSTPSGGTLGAAAGLQSTISGAKSNQVTININKMIERLDITALDLDSGMKDLEAQVQDIFLRIIASGSRLANQ